MNHSLLPTIQRNNKMENFEGKQLRTFRKFIKLSQGDLANEYGCQQSEISKYETGIHLPPIQLIRFLRKKYKLSYKWYFDREFPMQDVEQPKKDTLTYLQDLKDTNDLLIKRLEKAEKDILYLASKL